MRIPKSIKKKILKAREFMIKVDEIKYDIHLWMNDNDLESIKIETDNCYNLAEAIECFIDYGETIDNNILLKMLEVKDE